MLGEFLDRYRGRLAKASQETMLALRRCATLDDLRKAQGLLDGLDRARLIFDETVREWSTDDPDSD